MNNITYDIPCNICNSKLYSKLFSIRGCQFVKCKNCGLVYINPRQKDEKIQHSYKKNKFLSCEYYLDTNREDILTFKNWIRLIMHYCPKGKLLDVGCGVGTLLKVAHDCGWNVTGVDLNKKSAEFVKGKYGLNIINTNIEDFKTPELFDAVTMIELIEHAPNPRKTINKARSLLKPGGFLFINTPNVESISSRISGRRWWLYKPNEHLYYFSRATIKRLLESEGFKVILIKKLPRKRNLYTVIDRFGNYSKPLSNILKLIFPKKLSQKILFDLSVGDIFVAAKKI